MSTCRTCGKQFTDGDGVLITIIDKEFSYCSPGCMKGIHGKVIEKIVAERWKNRRANHG